MRALCLIVVAALLLPASAPAKVRTVKSFTHVSEGTRVRVEGTLSIRGSTPFTFLTLQISDEEIITIQGHTPDIQQELKNLDGLRVSVEGKALPDQGETLPRLDVERYKLLPPPGAKDPLIGIVRMEGDACVLTTDEGKRYWIVGELAPAMCQHAGARVWMVGKKTKRGEGTKPSGATPFTPTGYGVINSAPQ